MLCVLYLFAYARAAVRRYFNILQLGELTLVVPAPIAISAVSKTT